MNSVISLLQSHRSIRKFTNQAIPAALFEQLIKAGQAASTSSFIQATTVIRISDQSLRKNMMQWAGEQPYIVQAPEFLVFCADWMRIVTQASQHNEALEQMDFDWAEQLVTATVDVALFAQNVVIAAESEGLGVCYIGGIRNNPDKVSDALQLPEGVYPVFGLCLGYPDQSPSVRPRLPLSCVLGENAYPDLAKADQAIADYDQLVKQYYIDRSKGKLDITWSEQMLGQLSKQTRPFMLKFLQSKGLLVR